MILDLTGTNPDNRNTSPIPINYEGGSIAILTPQGGFFHTSMRSPILWYNGEELIYGTDYRYAYRSKAIRDKYGISAHGSIILLRTGMVGTVDFDSFYIGGHYQTYKSEYVSYITSTEYLLSLYDVANLTDLPDELPPKSSILDLEKITNGMQSSVQIIFGMGLYLKDFEDELERPSTGYTWPDITINDLEASAVVATKATTNKWNSLET